MKKNAGSTMLVVLAVLGTLSACVIAALNYTSVVNRNVMRSNAQRAAVALGDGAFDYAFAHWREICQVKATKQLGTNAFKDISTPPAAFFPLIPNFTASNGENPSTGAQFTLANFKVTAVDPQLNPTTDLDAAPEPGMGMNRGQQSYYYLCKADVTLPTLGKPIKVQMRRMFEKKLESPWSYAIFYTDRLEIHPSPPFKVTGWVHTNENLYTGHDTLTFASKVTFGNDWGWGTVKQDNAKAFAPGDTSHKTETPSKPTTAANMPPVKDDTKKPMGVDPSIFDATDLNPNNDGYRELIERPDKTDPAFADTVAIGAARYYNQADVRILINESNQVEIRNINDLVLTGANGSERDKAIYAAFAPAIKKGDTFKDNREKTDMTIVTVDMSLVTKALTPKPVGASSGGELLGYKFNGIMYVSDVNGSATVKRGVRLKNGASMPDGGLTVASENPVYIQGDYNTGRTASVNTPSNIKNDGTGNNVVDGYTRQPCAVLADAVNILSNAWVDTNSTKDVSQRKASPTTVNTAIVSGIVASGTAPASAGDANSYSGGAENFPRFNESWTSSNTFTYYGSMVELFKSKQSVGYWGSSNVYDPPKRQWYFDTLFYTNPPPGTLSVVTYKKQRWFIE